MGLEPGDLSWPEGALCFAAFHEGLATGIVGTTRLAHLEASLALLRKGPLPQA
jgi:hypothetical protein